MDVLIYGAGQTGKQVFNNIHHKCHVVGFLDGNPEKKGTTVNHIKVLGDVDVLSQVSFDQIYIGTMFWEAVKKKLLEAGVKEDQIIIELPKDLDSPIRDSWLKCYKELYPRTTLSVAEAGVYRGDFAAKINMIFPNSTLHLFDTFEGFDERDVAIENEKYNTNVATSLFNNTSEDLVISKMTYPENVIIHKGYFPETAQGIDDTFIFVNLDFDLFHPVLEGLRFFYPKLTNGAVLLVHDYYHIGLPGIRDAINDFEKELKKTLIKIPIGDYQSIAIVKT